MPKKQLERTSDDYKKEALKTSIQIIEEELMRISNRSGIRKRIISGPDWFCRMIEEERNGKDNNTNK